MFGTTSNDQNLILTGYVGPGQLAIARQVGERLRLPFVDFDSVFEQRAGMPGAEMRALYGEARLKTLEVDLLQEIALYRGTAIHISGQTLLHSSNLPRMRETGQIICIVASLDATLQRLHLALGARFHNPRERELALGTLRREWAIRKCEGVVELDTSYMTEDQMVEAIAARWRELSGAIDWRV